jgi:uncharacterized protein (TIGR02646 family)
MRFVQKDPAYRTARLASWETYLNLLEIVRTGNKNLINETIYRDSYDTPDGKRSRVEDQLAKVYEYKCAYCERICKADIEHYRPKAGVTEAWDHPGYYWLCYEWSNLLPACVTCNREGAKHNQFPILGTRVYPPVLSMESGLNMKDLMAYSSPLINEKPYLLHPEIDRPENFFSFVLDPNGEGIRIRGIDIDGRGEKTIAICRLNRKELTLDRVTNVIADFKNSVECLFIELIDHHITEEAFVEGMIQLVRALKNFSMCEYKTHTFLRKFIVATLKNFEEIVLPFLTPKTRNIVREAYQLEQAQRHSQTS